MAHRRTFWRHLSLSNRRMNFISVGGDVDELSAAIAKPVCHCWPVAVRKSSVVYDNLHRRRNSRLHGLKRYTLSSHRRGLQTFPLSAFNPDIKADVFRFPQRCPWCNRGTKTRISSDFCTERCRVLLNTRINGNISEMVPNKDVVAMTKA